MSNRKEGLLCWILSLTVFLGMLIPAIAGSSGVSGGPPLPLTALNGGTGSATGAGLVGGYGTAADTSGTVTLTATTARTRNYNNGASALNYELPDASSVGEAILTFNSTNSGSSSGDLTLDPAAGDAVGVGATDANYVIAGTMGVGFSFALKSDGVSRWSWLVPPNNINYAGVGVLQVNGSTAAVTVTSTLGSALTTANSMTSATSLASVGTITTGSIASGFGTIATANTIGTTSTISAGAGFLYPNQTAPGNPATGWVVYSDTADGDLYAKCSDGTTIKLADKP